MPFVASTMFSPLASTGPSRYLAVRLTSQVTSGSSAGATLVAASSRVEQSKLSNSSCSAGVIHAGSLPSVGSAVGVDSSSSAGVGRLGALARVDRLRGRGIREQHRPELELRRRLDAVAGLVVELTRDADDDVRALGVDLGLGDARRVDALADDRDRLVELLLRDGLAGLDLRLEDDLRAALEVEGELRRPRAAAPDHAGGVDREQADDDDAEPGERSPGLANGGRPG